ncbi:hypothetical protein GT037_002017 [Alternaria burnsii]|uniref:Uncharacterized protein n=1 Tax=Alternaria burnsii TaxID=1187904 RepID=A0A8H7BIZ7_9PLEO|nr:uncharacterized protein GT037_002017 [Alternaria burnsii]KAF7680366.1 hypothetical protein GT037_002017 [Alternaria burnsii]
MPMRGGYDSRYELVRRNNGWNWIRRRSRSHGHGHQPPPMRYANYDPDYTDDMLRRDQLRVLAATSYLEHCAYNHRVVAWSGYNQLTPYDFGHHEHYSAVEYPRQEGHSRSASLPRNSTTPAASIHGHNARRSTVPSPSHSVNVPQNTTTIPNHDREASHSIATDTNHNDGIAERYPYIREHIRQHPRFWEAVFLAEKIEKFQEGDRELDSYQTRLDQIVQEISKDVREQHGLC